MRLLYSKPELRDLSQGSRISFARQFRFMSQHELADKENLRPIELVIEKIFKSDYDLKYNVEANHRVHLSVRINRGLKQREKTMLNAKIKSEFYHTEIKESEEITIINIYNENPSLSLGIIV